MLVSSILGRALEHIYREIRKGVSLNPVALLAVADYIASREKLPNVAGLNCEEARNNVQHWIKVAVAMHTEGCTPAAISTLNSHLLESTYLASHAQLTVADAYLFAIVHAYVVANAAKVDEHVGVFRWFRTVQARATGACDLYCPVDFANCEPYDALPRAKVPAPAANGGTTGAAPASASKVKESATKAAETTKTTTTKTKTTATVAAAESTTEATNSVAEKEDGAREKKREVKQEQQPKAAANAAAPAAQDAVPSRLDLRVGRIVSVAKHPDADALYVEKIDLGEGENATRTVISGLVRHVPIEQMMDRMLVVVCNLKPAKMRGILSEGMVLCSTAADGRVEILAPPANSRVGDRVTFDGFEDQAPDAQLNPKKKTWESIQPFLWTDAAGVAGFRQQASGGAYEFRKMKTANGVVTAPTQKLTPLS